MWDDANSVAELNTNGTVNGNIATYHRDDIGRITKIAWPDGTYKEYQYVVDFDTEENSVYIRDENGNRTYQSFTPMGQEQDTRYYNPRIGRFTSEDVAKDGINWYTYCGNNPIANYDPSGMWTFAIGEGWNYTMGTGSSSSMQFSFDTHGYYAIHEAQTNKADQNHMGLCDVGLTPFVQITWLDGVRDLEKDIVNYGISGGFFEYAGLDVLFLDGKPIGVQVAAGPGMGVDAHVMQSDTYAHDFGHVTEIPDKIAEIPDKMAQGLGDNLWSWFEFGTGETYSQFKWR